MSPDTIGVGLVGYAFMGRAHSQAWLASRQFFSPGIRAELTAIAGRDAEAARDVADRFEWRSVRTDWRDLLDDPAIGLIDICTPGDTHAEIAIAALAAGKHVLVEKPMANTLAEAEAMAEAAAAARRTGTRSMVGFTYRRLPAIALAREIVARGGLGRVYSVRGQYLQDWLADPKAPWTWRLDRTAAGSGALGDIGAHVIDLAQYVVGDRITTVSGTLTTAHSQRVDAGGTSRAVTVDDSCDFVARFASGASGSFTATRLATGRKNALRLEVSGENGALAFDLEDMNYLEFYDTSGGPDAGFRRIMVTDPQHPYVGAWWPPGHSLGYAQPFTHQAVDLLNAIADGTDPAPSFEDGLQVQRVLASIETSDRTRSWTTVIEAAEEATP
ncbi:MULTISPECIES: Gfo/Idh/MocA family protein [Tsukamurella]|uniref:Gfo/Idh/MocA family oxidoreductase n=1 Tax=Tsukamurella strandjordii TaxID=147577 RepID=A0AA90SPZ0_9ACTN|nr:MULTISPECIES: Gfo/Idh/MocA family oxidoreductase [Tsukamurella]MDP0397341.1 Gfo/Idh/MocA family oxidoreductase [Tsukamurella strandjordii]GIZ98770.1 oxidoreductase [Tsukamurella sp. TY48]